MARSFNGSTDKITLTTPSVTSGDVTVSVWVYPNNFTNDYATPINWTSNTGIGIRSTGHVAWYWSVGIDPGSGALSTNTWVHLCLQFSSAGASVQGFINAASDGTHGGASSPATGSATIGTGTGWAALNGRVADLAVWNVLLSSSEITALANGALPYTIREGSLKSYLPLDGLASPEPDLSGGANNGTLTGTAFALGPPVMMFTPRWPMGSILPTPLPPAFILMPQIVM